MRILFAFSLLLMLNFLSWAQAPTWQWAKSAGSAGISTANQSCTDGAGNFYLAGSYGGSQIIFGNYTLNDTAFRPGCNCTAAYLVKYNAGGEVEWALGGSGYSQIFDVCPDGQGNLLLIGEFLSDTFTFSNTILANFYIVNCFIMRIDTSGNVLQAQLIDRQGPALVISPDNKGNFYTSGNYPNTPTLIFGNDTLDFPALYGTFVARYNQQWTPIWARAPRMSEFCRIWISGANVSPDGGVYATGTLQGGHAIFGADTLSSVRSDIYIVKYDSLGNVQWAETSGGPYYVDGITACTNAQGNILIAGTYIDTAVFGADTIYGHGSTAGNTNVFTVKYQTDANVQWVATGTGKGNFSASGINVDSSGNVYVTGSYSGSDIVFGADTLHSENNEGGVFIVKYDPNGNPLWVQNAFCSNALGENLNTDNNGNLYVNGVFNDTISCGDYQLINPDTIVGYTYIFTGLLSNTAGIQSLNPSEAGIQVYPNPSAGNIYFKGVQPGSCIQLFNIWGELVYTDVATRDNTPISLDNVAKGVYYYSIQDKMYIRTGKVVVQ